MSTEEKKTLTITLTSKRPVKIVVEDWPVRASSSFSEHDGKVECQANRKTSAWLKVRQHIDGRTLVYGGYDYDSNWQNEASRAFRDGEMLTPTEEEYPLEMRTKDHDWLGQRVIDAITGIGTRLGERSEFSGFDTLIAECIADLPAEDLT